VAAVLVVSLMSYGLAVTRPVYRPTPSRPFSMHDVGRGVDGRVVMRINGEPVTESEFDAALNALPEDTQRQFASEPGKVAFAEQYIRLKLLEQEARRLGLTTDPKISAQLSSDRTNVLANAAANKLAAQPNEKAVQKFYAENKSRFEIADVSHILIAHEGGNAPPRSGGKAPSEQEAMKRANALVQQLKSGADFATLARKFSDDTASGKQGGRIGVVGRGMLPQDVEPDVFSIPAGQVGAPVKSRFGIHIFKVNSRGERPLDEMRSTIVQRVRQQDMFSHVEMLRHKAQVNFDQKFFPDLRRGGRKDS
jgi:parvulin-like peptidyl-prolyl isomerase